MIYVAPTPAIFKARHPEFAGLTDPRIQAVLDEAIPHVGEDWLERDRQPAQMYLTAHMLVMEGALLATSAQVGGVAGIGSVKVGDVAVTLKGTASGGASSSPYDQTSYGQRYLELLRRNFAGPLVV